MAIVEISGAELLAIMENAVSRAPALDGRFPQVAGLLMDYDATFPGISDAVALTTPSRVRTLIVSNADGSDEILVAGFVVRGDLGRTFQVVTNSFLLTGGDGYQAMAAAATTRGSQNPGVSERQILTDYIEQVLGGAVDLPEPLTNERITRIDETG
jgi:2',3'-cyclic-nucleotide 2'-phosphodiesterase (5'-nucleotidase family)